MNIYGKTISLLFLVMGAVESQAVGDFAKNICSLYMRKQLDKGPVYQEGSEQEEKDFENIKKIYDLEEAELNAEKIEKILQLASQFNNYFLRQYFSQDPLRRLEEQKQKMGKKHASEDCFSKSFMDYFESQNLKDKIKFFSDYFLDDEPQFEKMAADRIVTFFYQAKDTQRFINLLDPKAFADLRKDDKGDDFDKKLNELFSFAVMLKRLDVNLYAPCCVVEKAWGEYDNLISKIPNLKISYKLKNLFSNNLKNLYYTLRDQVKKQRSVDFYFMDSYLNYHKPYSNFLYSGYANSLAKSKQSFLGSPQEIVITDDEQTPKAQSPKSQSPKSQSSKAQSEGVDDWLFKDPDESFFKKLKQENDASEEKSKYSLFLYKKEDDVLKKKKKDPSKFYVYDELSASENEKKESSVPAVNLKAVAKKTSLERISQIVCECYEGEELFLNKIDTALSEKDANYLLDNLEVYQEVSDMEILFRMTAEPQKKRTPEAQEKIILFYNSVFQKMKRLNVQKLKEIFRSRVFPSIQELSDQNSVYQDSES